MLASGYDTAETEDLAGFGDPQRFGLSAARREEKIDLAGEQNINAAGAVALAEQQFPGRPAFDGLVWREGLKNRASAASRFDFELRRRHVASSLSLLVQK